MRLNLRKKLCRIAISETSEEFCCSISDTGIGISAEDLPKVFQSFQQFARRRGVKEGDGLALSICKGLIEMHQGNLVESRVGEE